jgi:hypothetical protein
MTVPDPTFASTASATGRADTATHTGFRLSWGAIFAGLVMATALQIVLATLGGAIGLAAFDPGSGRGLGIGAALWAVASILVSLYLGGGTTGRLAGVLSRKDAFLHGALLWALSTLLTVWLVSRGVGAVTGTAFRIAGNVAGATAGAVAQGASSAVAAGVANERNDGDDLNLRQELQTLLRQTGDASLSPDSLRADARAAGQTATGGTSNDLAMNEILALVRDRASNLDREDVINVVTARTGRSRAEAERIADRVMSANQQMQSQVAEVRAQAGTLAEDVASGASTGLWFALLGFGLSLGAAVFGARATARE